MTRLRNALLIASLSLNAGLVLIACEDPPSLDIKLWAGDSEHQSIRRAQENQEIFASSPEFDEYVCTTYTDLKRVYQLLSQCKRWESRGKAALNEEPVHN